VTQHVRGATLAPPLRRLSDPRLPADHFACLAAGLPLHALLLAVHPRGNRKIRIDQGFMARREANSPVSPVASGWGGSGTVRAVGRSLRDRAGRRAGGASSIAFKLGTRSRQDRPVAVSTRLPACPPAHHFGLSSPPKLR
jgi:hypothetical protein